MSGRKQAAKAAQAVFQRKDLVLDVSGCVKCSAPLQAEHPPQQCFPINQPEGIYRFPLCEGCHREYTALPKAKAAKWANRALGLLVLPLMRERLSVANAHESASETGRG